VTPVPYSLQPQPLPGHEAEHHRRLSEGSAHVQSLVEADLSVVATVFIFARLRPAHTVHRVEVGVAGIWTVGAIFLFTSLGASLGFPAGANPLLLFVPILIGLICRLGMVTLIMATSARRRGVSLNLRNLFYEVVFVMAATLPRATIQGVLGNLPLSNGIVSPELGQIYAATAALTVLIFAPLGTIIQTLLCERCLSRTDMPVVQPGTDESGQHVAVPVETAAGPPPTTPGRAIAGKVSAIFEPAVATAVTTLWDPAVTTLWEPTVSALFEPNEMTLADHDDELIDGAHGRPQRSDERYWMDAPSSNYHTKKS
jgi:hypothetical protein